MSTRIRDFLSRGVMPLVGRDREMRRLQEAFDGLLEGEPRSVWMSGPAGVGKSRLLDELKSRAGDVTVRSLVVHAKWYEGEGLELGPLGNALEVLRPALAAPLAARIWRDGAVATVDAAVEAVQIASRRYPVVVILDDLHYLRTSDELSRFVEAIEEIPLLLVCTTRPVDSQPLRALRSALAGSIPPQELELGPLDGAGIADAATSLFGTTPPEGMLEQIAALSAGLPLALREVFRELIAADHLSGSGDGWRWESERLAEEELRAIGDRVHGFSGRLASLPEKERHLLALAAVLGEQFNRELLRQLAERSVGWDDHAFERLILGGFIGLSTPSVRLGARDGEGRVCFAFVHTLLWKAAVALESEGLPSRGEIAANVLDILTRGAGEIYAVAPLEALDVTLLGREELARLFSLLVAIGRRLSPLYSEAFVALCAVTLDRCRRDGVVDRGDRELHDLYLAALSAYGERLYLVGARSELGGVAEELVSLLEELAGTSPKTVEERIVRLDAAVVVWRDALMRNEPERARGFLDTMLAWLPPPSEQSDRELRGAAEAMRLLVSYDFDRGDYAAALDLASPYLPETDRMRPETLCALMKVLLPALLRAGRQEEAREMVEAALRLRREADLFTEYELLQHAANYAKSVRDFESVRRYATEARALVDQYPAYRNLSTNYWHLPTVAAVEGKVDELERLEREFRSAPPPARSSRLQSAVARLVFQAEWNLLGRHEHALRFAEDLDGDIEVLSPFHRLRSVQERVVSLIDAGAAERGAAELARLEATIASLGSANGSGPRVQTLASIVAAMKQDDPAPLLELLELLDGEKGERIDPVDAFRIARLLLAQAEKSPGRKRELNDAAYRSIELAIAGLIAEKIPAVAHYWLDTIGEDLPRTRLQRFRQSIGEDDRGSETPTDGAGSPDEIAGGALETPMLRTFGALRSERADEGGSKVESKTRSLVAALVVARLGDQRALGELTRDRLADLLWPDMALEKGVNNLHATMSYARRFLGGPSTIVQSDGVYELGDEVTIDAVEFREAIKRGNRLYNEGVYFGAAVAYRQALELATGDFLEGMYAEWVDAVRESLRGELATALERLIALELDRENYAAIPPLADRLLALDDLHDGAFEALIRSAASRGARREAFGYFNRYQAALDAYGAGPARRISELMEKVKAGEV